MKLVTLQLAKERRSEDLKGTKRVNTKTFGRLASEGFIAAWQHNDSDDLKIFGSELKTIAVGSAIALTQGSDTLKLTSLDGTQASITVSKNSVFAWRMATIVALLSHDWPLIEAIQSLTPLPVVDSASTTFDRFAVLLQDTLLSVFFDRKEAKSRIDNYRKLVRSQTDPRDEFINPKPFDLWYCDALEAIHQNTKVYWTKPSELKPSRIHKLEPLREIDMAALEVLARHRNQEKLPGFFKTHAHFLKNLPLLSSNFSIDDVVKVASKREEESAFLWRFNRLFPEKKFRTPPHWSEIDALATIAAENVKIFQEKYPINAAEESLDILDHIVRISSSIPDEKLRFSHLFLTISSCLVSAKVDVLTRRKWLEQILAIIKKDRLGWTRDIASRFSEICASERLANEYADRFLDDRGTGSILTLKSLEKAGRFRELIEILDKTQNTDPESVQMLMGAYQAIGKLENALEVGESFLSHLKKSGNYADYGVKSICHQILLKLGRKEEAYQNYALEVTNAINPSQAFEELRAIYSEKIESEIFDDLISKKLRSSNSPNWLDLALEHNFYDPAFRVARSPEMDLEKLLEKSKHIGKSQASIALELLFISLEKALFEDSNEQDSLTGHGPRKKVVQIAFSDVVNLSKDNLTKNIERIRKLLESSPFHGTAWKTLHGCIETVEEEQKKDQPEKPIVMTSKRPRRKARIIKL